MVRKVTLLHPPETNPTTNPIANRINPNNKQFFALDGSSFLITKYAIIPPRGVSNIARRYHQLLRCFCIPVDPELAINFEPHFEQNPFSEFSSFPQLEQNVINLLEH